MLWGPGLTLLLLNAQPNLQTSAALAQMAQRLRARLAGPHLEIHKIKFIAQIGMRVLEIFPDAHKRLIEGKTDLHADDREIKRIGQRDRDATLAVFDHALQHETGDKEPKATDADHQQKVEALLDCDHAQHPH